MRQANNIGGTMNYKKTEIEKSFATFLSEQSDEWVRDNWYATRVLGY